LSKLQVIARNPDWFIVLFAPIVIGWGSYFDTGFQKSFENLSKRVGNMETAK